MAPFLRLPLPEPPLIQACPGPPYHPPPSPLPRWLLPSMPSARSSLRVHDHQHGLRDGGVRPRRCRRGPRCCCRRRRRARVVPGILGLVPGWARLPPWRSGRGRPADSSQASPSSPTIASFPAVRKAQGPRRVYQKEAFLRKLSAIALVRCASPISPRPGRICSVGCAPRRRHCLAGRPGLQASSFAP